MNRRQLIIFTIVLTNLLGAGVVIPTLPLFAEKRFGTSATETGVFISLYFVAQFIAAPIMGQLADRFGRKPVLVWSQVGTVASFLLFIFAAPIAEFFGEMGVTVLASGFVLLSIARVVDGITGGNITAAQAYITDITPEKDHAVILGYIHIAFASGIIFGPALGGALSQFGLLAPFIGAAVITSISLLLTILFLDESLPAEKRIAKLTKQSRPWHDWSASLRNEKVLLLLGLAFIVNITIAGLSAIFPLFAERVAFSQLPDRLVARNVGFMMAYIGIAAVFGQVVLNRLVIQRFGEQNVMLLSIGAAWLTCIGLSLFVNPLLLTLALTPGGFAYAIGIPAGEALLVRDAPAQERGQLIGLYNAAASAAYIVGPILAGFVFDNFSPRSPFLVSTIFVIFGFGLAFRLKTRTIQNKRLHNL